MAKATDKETNHYIIKELSKKAPGPWAFSCAFDWLVIVLAFVGAGAWGHTMGYILAIFVIGNRQHGLALLGHDGTHYTIHKAKFWNDLISDVFAFWPVGLTTSGYRFVHFQHHQHLNTAHDPELMHRSSKAPQWDLPVTPRKIALLSFLDLFGYSASDYFMIIKFAKPNSRWVYLPMAAMHATFIIFFCVLQLYWVPLLWYAAVLTTFMMFFRIRTWLEHQGSDDTHKIHLNWFENAVFAPHHSWHHYEHHSYPTVPLHRLHIVRRLLREDPGITMRELMRQYKAIALKSGTPTKPLPEV
ncbi:MAG: fatty acid desaturase [Alphaproteobacteria bacterium]|nr:fatty acid desaturase [Alphaproteobacteria bacterium]MBU0859788.1 fatty acid desaturase [Alphaproteobacteria bacterium]